MASEVVKTTNNTVVNNTLIPAALRLLSDEAANCVGDLRTVHLLRDSASFIEQLLFEISTLKEQFDSKAFCTEQLNSVRFTAVLKAINYCDLPRSNEIIPPSKVLAAVTSYAREQWGVKNGLGEKK